MWSWESCVDNEQCLHSNMLSFTRSTYLLRDSFTASVRYCIEYRVVVVCCRESHIRLRSEATECSCTSRSEVTVIINYMRLLYLTSKSHLWRVLTLLSVQSVCGVWRTENNVAVGVLCMVHVIIRILLCWTFVMFGDKHLFTGGKCKNTNYWNYYYLMEEFILREFIKHILKKLLFYYHSQLVPLCMRVWIVFCWTPWFLVQTRTQILCRHSGFPWRHTFGLIRIVSRFWAHAFWVWLSWRAF